MKKLSEEVILERLSEFLIDKQYAPKEVVHEKIKDMSLDFTSNYTHEQAQKTMDACDWLQGTLKNKKRPHQYKGKTIYSPPSICYTFWFHAEEYGLKTDYKSPGSKSQIDNPKIFPKEKEIEDMSCDSAILWAIESFDIAHKVNEHDFCYENMSKEGFNDLFAESVFSMHDILNKKCGCQERYGTTGERK